MLVVLLRLCLTQETCGQVHDNPVASPVDAPTQWPLRQALLRLHAGLPAVDGGLTSSYARRNLRPLLEELIAISGATRGKEELHINLLPVGDDFEP